MKKLFYIPLLVLLFLIFNLNVKAYSSVSMLYPDYDNFSYLDKTFFDETYSLIKENMRSYSSYICFYKGTGDFVLRCSVNGYLSDSSSRLNLTDFQDVLAIVYRDGHPVIDNSSLSSSYSYINYNRFGYFIAYAYNFVFNCESDVFNNNLNEPFSYISSFNNYNLFCSNNYLYGFMNAIYDNVCVDVEYQINYFYNDVLDSSKTVIGHTCSGDVLNISNLSDSRFHIDDNVYSVIVSSDNNVFNIKYYDDFFGTNYNQIDTQNEHIYFPFQMNYIRSIFPGIDFTKFTMAEQFIVMILLNLFFILLIYIFISILRYLWFLFYRLF